MTTHTSSSTRLMVLGRARLTVAPGRSTVNHTVSGHCQKAVLLAIAVSEGEALSIAALSDRACCSEDATKRAVWALRQAGIINPVQAIPGRPCEWRIVWEKLLDLVPEVAA